MKNRNDRKQTKDSRYEKCSLRGRVLRLCLCLPVLLIAAAVSGCGREAQAYLASTQVYEDSEASPAKQTAETQAVPAGDTVLLVYVCGEVREPGVYELAEGSRICDAAEAAGGLTDEASRDYWNLAEPLTDGQMIAFPTVEEAKSRRQSAGEADAGASARADGRVNINTAELEELMTIPGVGKTRGEAILAFRSEHGSFAEPQDIKKVSGIGDATYERMKDRIAVE